MQFDKVTYPPYVRSLPFLSTGSHHVMRGRNLTEHHPDNSIMSWRTFHSGNPQRAGLSSNTSDQNLTKRHHPTVATPSNSQHALLNLGNIPCAPADDCLSKKEHQILLSQPSRTRWYYIPALPAPSQGAYIHSFLPRVPSPTPQSARHF